MCVHAILSFLGSILVSILVVVHNSAFKVAFIGLYVNSLLLYFFVHHIVVIFVSDDFNGG